MNHIDYMSLNSNPWDGNGPSLDNSWEPDTFKMVALILVNYKNVFIFTLRHAIDISLILHACFGLRGIQWNHLC